MFTAFNIKIIRIKRRVQSVNVKTRYSAKFTLKDNANDNLGVLIVDKDRHSLACKPVYYCVYRLETGADKNRALSADDVDI